MGSTEYRIWLTQVGDPLAYGQYDLVHGISSHRDTGGTGPSVSHSIDKEEAEADLFISEFTEGRGAAHFFAELAPTPEGSGGGVASLG